MIMTYAHPASQRRQVARQNGISLIMVLLVLILVALTALSASRSAAFNESTTGNEADFNRAMTAAEAVIRDAQIDIVGYAIVNVPCRPPAADIVGCRVADATTPFPTSNNPFFPKSQGGEDADALRAEMAGVSDPTIPCRQGICAPGVWPTNSLPDRFWVAPNFLTAYVPHGARYGQFTGANGGATGNPILANANPQAWYWVELIPNYAPLRCNGAGCPQGAMPFMYRITAVAMGRRANTIAVIQNYFVPTPPTL